MKKPHGNTGKRHAAKLNPLTAAINFRCSEEQKQQLNKLAKIKGIKPAQLMANLLSRELEANKEQLKRKVVSFSGGRTSAYLVHLLKDDPSVDFIFMDTGFEHPETYRFVREVVKFWDIKLTVLRAVISPVLGEGVTYKIHHPSEIQTHTMPYFEPFKTMLQKYGTPYIGGAFCTDRLKTQPFTKYCNDTYGKGNYETWLGIRTDEPKRLKQKEGIRYLAEISDYEKQDVINWWKKQPFDLGIEEHLGNCVFCIKKSVNKIALASRDAQGIACQSIYSINSKETRVVESRTTPSDIMYRGKNSLESIIAMFDSHTNEEIRGTIRSMKRFDTGSCSESCEAF